MAGRGPAPKPAHRRAGHSKDPIPVRTISADGVVGPQELPSDLLPDGEEWHPATVRWWSTFCASPLARTLLAVDWSELEACAVLHHEFMSNGDLKLASELRLRLGKFGSTPEDRARLRISVADADEREAKPSPVSRSRYRDLRGVPR